MRAWQAWPTLRDAAAARTWLLRITVNVCRQWRRGDFGKERRLTQTLPEASDVHLGRLVGQRVDTMGVFTADPGTSDFTGVLDLREAINELDDAARLVVVLRYYSGMDATEIGQALGVPAATVRTRLRRALDHLRKRLSLASSAPRARNQMETSPTLRLH